MPKRKRTRKSHGRKRRRTRRGRRRRDTMSSINLSNPFPNKFINKLRYQEAIKLNPGVGAVAANIFRASSVYDPNFTGVGHVSTALP